MTKTFESLAAAMRAIYKDIAEIRRLKEQAVAWEGEARSLIESGRCDEEDTVAAVSTLRTKAAMAPHRAKQLHARVEGAIAELDPLVTALRGEIAAMQTELFWQARKVIISKAREALSALTSDEALIERMAEEILAESDVNNALLWVTPSSSEHCGFNGALNALQLAENVEKIREFFFSKGIVSGVDFPVKNLNRKVKFAFLVSPEWTHVPEISREGELHLL